MEKRICNHCLREVETSNLRRAFLDGEYVEVCENCLREHFMYHNGEYYNTDYYGLCDDCEHVFARENLTYYEELDRTLCSYCESNTRITSDSRIHYYHYIQDNNIDWIPFATEEERDRYALRYIGYELEVEAKRNGYVNFNRAIDAIESKLNCVLETDSSLYNGFEIISQPQTYNYLMEHYEDYKTTFQTLIDNGIVSHDSGRCGLHFHFTAPSEHRDEIVTRLWYILENYKTQFEQMSRRIGSRDDGDDFHYTQFLSTYTGENNEKISKNLKKMETINKKGYRYLVINDRNEKTIELRLFRGTLNIETFYADLQLAQNLFELAYNLDIKVQDITWAKLTEGYYIKKYCEEKGITTDKKIVDESLKLQRLEEKAYKIANQIINSYKRYCVKQSKNVRFEFTRNTEVNDICNEYTSKISNINSKFMILQDINRAVARKCLEDTIHYMGYLTREEYSDGLDVEAISSKINKIKEYYNEING